MSLMDAINAAGELDPPLTEPAAIAAWLGEEIGRTPINRVVNYQDVIDLAGPTTMAAIHGALESVLADSFDPQDPPAWYAAARSLLQQADPSVTDASMLAAISQSHDALRSPVPGAGVGTASGVVLIVLGAMEAAQVVTTEAADALRIAGGEAIVRRWTEYGLRRAPSGAEIALAMGGQ